MANLFPIDFDLAAEMAAQKTLDEFGRRFRDAFSEGAGDPAEVRLRLSGASELEDRCS